MKHFFLRNASNFPVACIASGILTSSGRLTDGPLEPDSCITFALSVFNPSDSFDRARASSIARARLLQNKAKTLAIAPASPSSPRTPVKLAILNSLLAEPTMWSGHRQTYVHIPAQVIEALVFQRDRLIARLVSLAAIQPVPPTRDEAALERAFLGSAPLASIPSGTTFTLEDPPLPPEPNYYAGVADSLGSQRRREAAPATGFPGQGGPLAQVFDEYERNHPPDPPKPWTWHDAPDAQD